MLFKGEEIHLFFIYLIMKSKGIILFVILAVAIFLSTKYFGKLIEKKMSVYVFEEVDRVTKMIVREVLDEEFLNSLDIKDLYKLDFQEDSFKVIDYDVVKVNKILGIVNNNVSKRLNDLDCGNVGLIYEGTSFVKYSKGDKHGIALNVPLGVLFSNPVLVSVGPKVPIRVLLSGQVESDLITSIRQYGINNILLEIKVKVVVSEKVVFPFSSKYIDVDFEFPLILELISGKVPENYLNTEKFDIIE